MLQTPVLFLIFNRPDLTEKVFTAIKEVKPIKLFVAADGPRDAKTGEYELCEQARSIIKRVDWDCEVNTLFRKQNLGCKKAVSSAISWFFDNVEEGIILEDDILPDATFFQFCEELLEKYRRDNRIMAISGANILESWHPEKQSYFPGHIGIWGWASWRRAWQLYDINMKLWQDDDVQKCLGNAIGSEYLFGHYKKMFNAAYSGELDTWDLQWVYTILINRGLALNPSVNLIRNIGFRADASHTHDTESFVAKLVSKSVNFPLIQPHSLMLNIPYLNSVAEKLIGPPLKPASIPLSLYRKVKSKIRKLI